MGLPDPATSDEVIEGRSWWKACCAGCCLGFIALFLGGFLMIRFMWGSGPKTVQELPPNFPSQFVVFRPEAAQEIVYYPGTSKTAATKIVTGPLSWLGQVFGGGSATGSVQAVGGAINAQLRSLEGRDTVSIRWDNMQVSRDEVLRFYAGALRQVGIYNAQANDPKGTWDVHMKGANTALSFSLIMSDDPDRAGIDSMTIVVDYPVATSK